jgi:hypothetical protein
MGPAMQATEFSVNFSAVELDAPPGTTVAVDDITAVPALPGSAAAEPAMHSQATPTAAADETVEIELTSEQIDALLGQPLR